MTAMATPRKSFSIQDYPEHLNPFHEDDNHNKIRFWTIGRKLQRSNSITFSGIKDLKNSWAFRSFMKKGKKGQQTEKPQTNGESSPILYRRALQYSSTSGARSTVASPERYVYGGSITPLPRSRFQERLRSSSQYEVNSLSYRKSIDSTALTFQRDPRMARSEVSGSRLSVGSTNPFDEEPVPPVRARRKKKKAPLPPSLDVSAASTLDTSQETSELQISEANDSKLSNANSELDNEDVNFNVELKIVEDEDLKDVDSNRNTEEPTKLELEIATDDNDGEETKLTNTEHTIKNSDSEDDILTKASFDKIDIVKYRRNSSVNEDEIRLRRGNLEDFHALSNKRSKSLNNTYDASFTTYDINLNESNCTKDANGNEEPSKVVCKLYNDTPRKQSIDTVSSTEKEFMEIDRATRELEREISKLNSALHEDEDITSTGARLSVSDIKRKFDKTDVSSPNPIPKPRRSHYGDLGSPVNGNIPT